MRPTHTFARSLHDLGLAAWFGGSLMGSVGLNGASTEVDSSRDALRVANAGWGRWQPVQIAAVGAHLLGSLRLTQTNKGRIAGQRGVGTLAVTKAVLTAAATGATAYAGWLGMQASEIEAQAYLSNLQHGPDEETPVAGATTPSERTPPELAEVQRRLSFAQWAIPALTAGVLVCNAWMGEQQRPTQVVRGTLGRLNPKK